MSSLIGRVRLHLGHAEGRLVNRLDRETSGLVVVARHREAARDLGRLFAGADVEKSYIAIVHGRLPEEPFVISAPLGKDDHSLVVIKDSVRDDGAFAETRVRRVEVFGRPEGAFSVAEVTPRTGRKHQIRIHLAHAGFPIVGDKIYGGDETRYLRLVTGALTDADRRALLLPHHALHAARLACTLGGVRRAWTAPEPGMLRRFRSGLTVEDAWSASRDEAGPDPASGPSPVAE